MGFTLLFDDTSRVLLIRFDGTLTRESLEAMMAAARDFAQRQGSCDGIVDFTSVTHTGLDLSYLRALGSAPRIMKGKRRVLVAPQPALFGLLRMYGLHQAAAGEEPMVVHSYREAAAILGLTGPDFRPLDDPKKAG